MHGFVDGMLLLERKEREREERRIAAEQAIISNKKKTEKEKGKPIFSNFYLNGSTNTKSNAIEMERIGVDDEEFEDDMFEVGLILIIQNNCMFL